MVIGFRSRRLWPTKHVHEFSIDDRRCVVCGMDMPPLFGSREGTDCPRLTSLVSIADLRVQVLGLPRMAALLIISFIMISIGILFPITFAKGTVFAWLLLAGGIFSFYFIMNWWIWYIRVMKVIKHGQVGQVIIDITGRGHPEFLAITFPKLKIQMHVTNDDKSIRAIKFDYPMEFLIGGFLMSATGRYVRSFLKTIPILS